jgi:hypothetical protein
VQAGLNAGTNNIGDVDILTIAAGDNNIGNVDVESVVAGTGPTNLGKAEDAAHTSGDTGVMSLAVRNDSDTALAGTTLDYAPLQVDATGYLKVNVKAGSLAGPSVNDDEAFTVGVTPVAPVGGLYMASPDSVDTGDIGAFGMTANRSLFVALRTPNGDSAMDDTNDSVKVTISSGSIVGIADDAAFTIGVSEVLPVGYLADDTSTDSVNEGDIGAARMTLNRKIISQPYEGEGNSWSYAAPAGGLVNTTEVTAKASAGSGLINYITSIQVTNSHATTGTEIQVLDGTAGTVKHRGFAAALGGYVATFPVPIKMTAATLVSIKEATTTATTGVLVNLQGYVGA